MKGVVVLPNSPYYYYRFYDKQEPDPKERRKLAPVKIEVTKEDRRIFENNRKNGTKNPYRGNAALRLKLESFRHALVNRDFEILTGSQVKTKLTPEDGKNEYFNIKPDLKPSTKRIYDHAITILNAAIKPKPICDYTQADMGKYVEYMKQPHKKAKEGFKQSSISIITMHLSAIWNYFVKQKYCTENVVLIVKPPAALPHPIPETDLTIIKDHFETCGHPEWNHYVKFLLYTGIRPTAALEQLWEWVDFKEKTIMLFNQKSSSYFFFPLYGDLEKLLEQMGRKTSGKMFTFSSYHSLKFFPRQMNILMGKKLTGEADPEGVQKISMKYSLYNLRDSFATGMANKMDMSFVKELMNHSDDRVTRKHYAQVRTSFLMQKIEEKAEPKTEQKSESTIEQKDGVKVGKT